MENCKKMMNVSKVFVALVVVILAYTNIAHAETDNRRNPGGAAYSAAIAYTRYLELHESDVIATNPSWYRNIQNKQQALWNMINGINYDTISVEQMTKIQNAIGALHDAVRGSQDESNLSRMIEFDRTCNDLRNAYSITSNSIKVANAQDTANTAVTNAATAQSTANTAVTNAAAAQSTANTALTNAATAQKTADTAAKDAATAQKNINIESAIRAAADVALQNNIDAETAARIAYDAILKAQIEAEVKARMAAVATLQNNIDNEAAARRVGDAYLDYKIMNESRARQQADEEIRYEMRSGFEKLDQKINDGVAISLAIAGLKMPEYDQNHKLSGAIGFGNFHSSTAIAFGLCYQFNKDLNVNMSYACSGKEGGLSGGVSFKF